MSYNGSGTFVINSTGLPVITATTTSSTMFNAMTADLATGLSTAICKDGQTATTARIPFASGISTAAANPVVMTNGQAVTVALTSQTSGVATLTIPDFAGVSDEFTFKTKSQTMSNKTFIAPTLGVATGTRLGLGAAADGTYLLNLNGALIHGNSTGIGIGTTGPSTTLHVISANVATNSVGNLFIQTSDAKAIDVGGQLSLGGKYDNSGNVKPFAGISGRKEDGADSAAGAVVGYMSFSTTTGGTLTEHMRIASSGNVGIGTTSPATSALLELASTTGALLIPRMTTTQKNALTAVDGMIVYDSTLGKFYGREAGAWNTFSVL